jgi:hypothetical protein
MSIPRSQEIVLLGGPDVDATKATTPTVQLMHLEMSNDIFEQLVDSTRRGKLPRIFFGANPVRHRLKAHYSQQSTNMA